MLISYVLDGASHGHGMDELAQRVLDHDCITYESLCGKGAAQIGFAQVPVDKATAYAAEDAEVTLRLWQHLRPRLLEERMVAVYETLDRPLSPIVTEMERHGIKVDAHRLRSCRPSSPSAWPRSRTRPTSSPAAASTWARPSSWARCCSTS